MKIGFTGTVSVGKTTLVKELQLLPEFKDYVFATERSKYLRDLGIPLNTDSTLNGQMIFQAERAMELLNENLITDRTIIDVMAFTYLSKTINRNDKFDLLESMSLLIKQYDHIFYINTNGTVIEDNGIRTIDARYRQSVDCQIQHFLEGYEVNYTEITGNNKNRIKDIMKVIT